MLGKIKSAFIIDDNENSIELLRYALVDLDYNVTTVRDVDEILNMLHRISEVNVVFLDLQMQEDGVVVHKRLRNAGLKAPIVAYTSFHNRQPELHEAGFDGLIAKPLNIPALPDKLRRIHRGQAVWRD